MAAANLPDFTAEASLYKTSGNYQSASLQCDATVSVLPQLRISQFPEGPRGLGFSVDSILCAALAAAVASGEVELIPLMLKYCTASA